MSAIEVSEVEDDEWLSQKVSRGRPDIDSPRPQDRDGVSVSRGRESPERMYRLVVKSGTATKDDGVRHGLAGQFRKAGFVVEARPSPRNPRHACVSYPGDWGHSEVAAFVSCFDTTVWFGDATGGEEGG